MNNEVIEITTQRLILRKLRAEDAADLFRYASCDKVADYMNFDRMTSIDEAHDFIDKILKKYETNDVLEWAVEYKPDKRMIGAVYFCKVDEINKIGEIGFIISQEYTGRGLATEALGSIIGFAFEKMGLNRVEGMHFSGNNASGRVMEKAGMQFEGLLKQRFFAKGRFYDALLYAICKSDIA